MFPFQEENTECQLCVIKDNQALSIWKNSKMQFLLEKTYKLTLNMYETCIAFRHIQNTMK